MSARGVEELDQVLEAYRASGRTDGPDLSVEEWEALAARCQADTERVKAALAGKLDAAVFCQHGVSLRVPPGGAYFLIYSHVHVERVLGLLAGGLDPFAVIHAFDAMQHGSEEARQALEIELSDRAGIRERDPDLGTLTDRQAEARIAALQAKYRVALATPLMSQGGMSATQFNRMGRRGQEKYQENGQIRLIVEARIRALRRPFVERAAAAAAEQAAAALKADREELDRNVRQVGYATTMGVGKRGKVKPTWQRQLTEGQAKIREILGRRPELASEATARALDHEAAVAKTVAEDAARLARGGPFALKPEE